MEGSSETEPKKCQQALRVQESRPDPYISVPSDLAWIESAPPRSESPAGAPELALGCCLCCPLEEITKGHPKPCPWGPLWGSSEPRLRVRAGSPWEGLREAVTEALEILQSSPGSTQHLLQKLTHPSSIYHFVPFFTQCPQEGANLAVATTCGGGGQEPPQQWGGCRPLEPGSGTACFPTRLSSRRAPGK